jgi:hypothetical protein
MNMPGNDWSPWPYYAPDELDAVQSVLRSGKVNYWTGSEGRTFEKEFAAAVGRRHAVALANGTLALELALRVLGIGAGDEVVVTPRTFIASASCAATCGARPVFADVDRDSQNVTAETISRVIGPETKAIIAVHLAGRPCDMASIMELAERRGIAVIEDCAQAHGATYQGRPVGSIGHLAAFSFCQDKIISTGGEGGMLVVDDDVLWSQAWSYKDHGKNYDAVYNRQHPAGFRWLHESFGSNWRLTEMQAAIGRLQLRKLPEWVATRRAHAQLLTEQLSDLPALRIPPTPADCEHAWYRFYAFVRPQELAAGWSRDRIMETATAAGIPCFSGSCGEIYLEQAFRGGMAPAERLPVARELAETSLALLVHPTLTTAEISHFGNVLRSIVKQATAVRDCREARQKPVAVYSPRLMERFPATTAGARARRAG